MRLLNVNTLEFGEFFDYDIPEYVILSHRWGKQEVTFDDFEAAKKEGGPRFSKIEKFCNLTKDMYHAQWVWIDTCCIDKKSSAELSEAINSMYRWYRGAKVCCVYLEDVVWTEIESGPSESSLDQFRQSTWFTRGWTLQELLAPWVVTFYDQFWNFIGDKLSLSAVIAAVTGISESRVSHPDTIFHDTSHAQKMSWMSQRRTTRAEDIAYCLLGLFQVNMPLLYGEGGERAFIRLQLEIIKQSDDESIFAWDSDKRGSGMLASSPRCFAASGDIVHHEFAASLRPPYAMTNKGLEFHIPDPPLLYGKIALNCYRYSDKLTAMIDVTPNDHGSNIWTRDKTQRLGWRRTVIERGYKRKAIYIR